MAARRGGGFWRGFLFGLAVAAVVSLGLAWTFPPLREPEVDERALTAPRGPEPPAGMGDPEATTPEPATPSGETSPSAPVSEPGREP